MIVEDNTPATGYGIADLRPGLSVRQAVTFTKANVEAFGALSADYAACHFDSAHARSMGFQDRIVHGLLVSSRFSRLMGMYLPGPRSVIQTLQINFVRPVLVGQPLLYEARVETVSLAASAVVLKLSVESDVGGDAEQPLVTARAVCVIPASRSSRS